MRYFWALLTYVTAIVVASASCSATNSRGIGFSGTGGLGSGAGSTGAANTGGSGAGDTGGSTGALMLQDASTMDGSSGGMCPAYKGDCTKQKLNCGKATDGCGNVLDCGTCTAPETCGASGTQNVCGSPTCTKSTCQSLSFDCGMTSDGCNGTLSCGTCPAGQTCGSTKPNVCGTGGTCTPKTCADQGFNCGMAGDTCGNAIDCGSCPTGDTCSLKMANVCSSTVCTSMNCAQQSFNCGQATDGCGNVIDCGMCPAGESCGGGGPNQCGTAGSCTGLCLQQQTCSNGTTTTVTGKVYAPNGVDPLYNVLVYVPNSAVLHFVDGVATPHCSCGSDVTGNPLVSGVTGTDGSFTITNMPVGANIPLVIQNGRWRRQFVIPTVAACTSTALPTTGMPQIRMPRTKAEGDIPLMGFVTGSVDALECVLLKVGIDASEFSDPSGTGRVRFYQGAGGPGATYSGNTPDESSLWGTTAEINAYDMVYFACQGDQFDQTTAAQNNVIQYANNGGRVFATHYSYVWLYDDSPFSTTAKWAVNGAGFFQNDPGTGLINTTFPRGLAMAQWLKVVGASTTLGQIPVNTLRQDFSSVVAPSLLWINVKDPSAGNVPLHYTFDTPVGTAPAQQCGRVLYSDFHVEDAITDGTTFPAECAPDTCNADGDFCCVDTDCCSNNCDAFNSGTCLPPTNGCHEAGTTCTTTSQCCAGSACTGGVCLPPMTPQEKMLEFMIFDLGSCVTPPMCTPKTCADVGNACGSVADGCGNIITCTCPSGAACINGLCGGGCAPTTCAAQGFTCGMQGDGCGNILDCGSCPSGTCGGGGKPGTCGIGTCTATTCTAQKVACGSIGDGCGNVIDCGLCPAGDVCVSGQCQPPKCTPKTCVGQGFNCGNATDGCGNIISCGSCSGTQTCGGGGSSNVCGGGAG
jgi:hypothetical protein